MANQPRIPLVKRDLASEEQRRIGDFIYDKRGEEYGGPSAILLHAPELAERFELMREHILAAGLPQDLLQLATLVLARHWSVDYIWNVRVVLAQKAGIDAAVIAAIGQRRRPQLPNEKHEAIYAYTSEMLSADGVSDATHQRARAALGSDVLMIELAALLGLYTMLAFECRAADLPMPAGGTALPK